MHSFISVVHIYYTFIVTLTFLFFAIVKLY